MFEYLTLTKVKKNFNQVSQNIYSGKFTGNIGVK